MSDLIRFGKGDNKKELKLSNVLVEYKDKSDILDVVVESFISISQKSKLRSVIFKTELMKIEEIVQRIEEDKSEYLTVYQYIFQYLFTENYPNYKWKKVDHYACFLVGEELIENEILFLNEIYRLKITDILYYWEDYVDEKWALPEELAPKWMIEWLSDDYTNKLEFIKMMGYNGEDSPIVKLRKAILNENNNENEIIRYY